MSKVDRNLITSYNFQGRDYLVKMTIMKNNLELEITDKQSGEQWECGYNTSYIENLTRKTGNFKQFDIFVTMLKSGLLKTSDCIILDLLTYDDLETLRIRKMKSSTHRLCGYNNNRRYLILTYSVEFDRINYPLPLEYCGLPDPAILQSTVRKLEADLLKANEKLRYSNKLSETHQIKAFQNRIEELILENEQLQEQIKFLTKSAQRKPKAQVEILQKAISKLEKNVISERHSHHKLVEKLQNDKMYLANQLEKTKISEKSLKMKLQLSRPNSSKTNSKEQVTYIKPTSKSSFKRKKSPIAMFTNKEHVRNQRSRSASPQYNYRNKQNQFSDTASCRSKSVESGSSISSRKRSSLITCIRKIYSSPLESPIHSRKASRSRSNSTESCNRSSVHNSRYQNKASPFQRQKATNNVKEFEKQIRTVYQNPHKGQY